MSGKSNTTKSSRVPVKRESYFNRFRKRWKRRGVIEIGEFHSKHSFTMYVRQGLQDSIEATNELKISCETSENEDTQPIHRNLKSTQDNTSFEFVTYAPQVFESLREQVGLFSGSYSECICPPANDIKYLEFVSNSKSGQNFFLSNDKRLMIKTHTANEKKFFLKILPRYIAHLKQYPHTLLVRYLGLYKITINRQDPVYFIVMQSILYPDERINQRFDLKACQAGRYTKEETETSNIITVMKDVNFDGKKLFLGPQSTWFRSQIEHDTKFLRELKVIDYSLLIGIQSLHTEEIKENKELASIVNRTKKSTSRQHSVLRHWAQSPTRLMTDINEESVMSQSINKDNGLEDVQLPGAVLEDKESDKETSPIKSSTSLSPKKLVSQTSSGSEQDIFPAATSSRQSVTETESIMQNRRLLPQCRNELHTIDGSNDERYFLGIIDFFTTFGIKKRCESAYKAILYKKSGLSYSTVHPDTYADRFQHFVTNNVV